MRMKKVGWVTPHHFLLQPLTLPCHCLSISPLAKWRMPNSFTRLDFTRLMTLGKNGKCKVKLFQKIFCISTSLSWTGQEIKVTIKAHLEGNYKKYGDTHIIVFVKVWPCFYAKHAFLPSIHMAEIETYNR